MPEPTLLAEYKVLITRHRRAMSHLLAKPEHDVLNDNGELLKSLPCELTPDAKDKILAEIDLCDYNLERIALAELRENYPVEDQYLHRGDAGRILQSISA